MGLLLPDGTPATPTMTWGQAAEAQLDAISGHSLRVFMEGVDNLPEYSEYLERVVEKMLSGDVSPNAIAMYLFDIGALALPYASTASLVDMLCGKQHDYGHGNILRAGMLGILVRLSDKSARLANLLAREAAGDTNVRNESLLDTVDDIVGYCVIGLMLMDGTFELPL